VIALAYNTIYLRRNAMKGLCAVCSRKVAVDANGDSSIRCLYHLRYQRAYDRKRKGSKRWRAGKRGRPMKFK